MTPARVLLVAIAALAILAAACADEDLRPTPTPRALTRATAGPKATLTPLAPAAKTKALPDPASAPRTPAGATPRREVEPSVLGPPTPFPADLAVIIDTGCTACDAPLSNLVRAYRDPRGVLRVETLLTPTGGADGFFGTPVGEAGRFRGPETPYLGITVAECRTVGCGASGLLRQPEEQVLLRSLDGGVTWAVVAQLPAALVQRPVAYVEGETLLIQTGLVGDPPRFTQAFTMYPSGRALEPPRDLELPFPVLFTFDDLLWHDRQDRFRWHSGRRAPDLGNGTFRAGLIDAVVGPLQAIAFGWYEAEDAPPGGPVTGAYMWGATRLRHVTSEVDRRFVAPGLVWPGAYAIGGDERRFVGTIDVPGASLRQVAHFDGATGEIEPFVFDSIDPVAPRRVHAAYQGPFARAIRGDTCTEVRAAPSPTAPVLECAASGVLFQRSAPPTVDGAWLGVTHPSGTTGWAETRYLEW